MSRFKLIWHDIYCGLLRWRYLATILLFLIPCVTFWMQLQFYNTSGTWGDYLLYCFKGNQIIKSTAFSDIQLPAQWLLMIGGCLYINLDYLLNDLTNAGQQVIIRSGGKREWYFSKCIWNFLSCLVYTILSCATVLLFAVLSRGNLSLANSPAIALAIYGNVIYEPIMLSVKNVLVLSVVLPFLSIAALSMLEMTLCLFVHPIISFVTCMFSLVLALFSNSPWVIGVGAMGIRSSLVMEGGTNPKVAAICAIVVIVMSIIVGCWRFKYTDILGLEE